MITYEDLPEKDREFFEDRIDSVLAALIPRLSKREIMRLMEERYVECWDGYQNVLSMPDVG